MKKRIIAFFLALMLAASAVGCANRPTDESTEDTREATEAVTEDTTQATAEQTEPSKEQTEPSTEQTEPSTEQTQPPAEFPDVSQAVYFPILENIGNATLEEAGMLDEDTLYFGYTNGSEEDLDLFITLCGYCGLYRSGGHMDDGSILYYLIRPGEDFVGIASLMPDGERLYIQIPEDFNGLGAPEIQVMMDYYLQDLTLPTGYGPNVMPEFYASIGRSAANMDGLTSNIFPGDQELCWYELYFDVDYPTLHRYLSDMMLCGFDIKYDHAQFGEGTMVASAVYMLDNGSSRVAVSYDAESGNVHVYYEPGVDRYLFKGAEYAKYIPQP